MKVQKNRCPICQRPASPRMGKLTNYWFCRHCTLGWIKKNPRAAYKKEYYISGSSVLSKLFSPLGNIFFLIRNSYSGMTKKNLWIDVGAGEGSYLEKVQAKKKIGVEISASGRSLMKKKGLSVLTNSEFLKTKNLNADCISFWHVLEHVTNPAAYVKSAQKNLRKSGKVIIAVPNIDSFEFVLFSKFWFHLAPKHHLWFFSPLSLKKMTESAGLRIEKVDHWAIEHHLTGILQSCINATTQTDNILHKLIKRKQNLSSIKISHVIWIFFWCTIGLPAIIFFWIASAVFRKPGTIVMVVSKK